MHIQILSDVQATVYIYELIDGEVKVGKQDRAMEAGHQMLISVQ